MSAMNLRCVKCSNYLFSGPFQCSCGDRLCGDCFQAFKTEKKMIFTCPKCGEEISLDDCFKDKAAENELKTATIKCTNQDCPWEGPGQYYKEHIKSCKFTRIQCPNKEYGCPKLLLNSQLDEHLERECQFTPVQCPWCSKKVHNKDVSNHVKKNCAIPQADIQQVQEGCTAKQLGKINTFYISRWTIPEVQHWRGEAKSQSTVSLYSEPFYTSHRGYKMCLRLYMDGDGRGKGTHISVFLALMRGEYDAQLPWPFNRQFELILVDQEKKGRDYIRSFKPDPLSPSFQQPSPHSDMNVASGCPEFAPLSILDNPAYVKGDNMIIEVKIMASQ